MFLVDVFVNEKSIAAERKGETGEIFPKKAPAKAHEGRARKEVICLGIAFIAAIFPIY